MALKELQANITLDVYNHDGKRPAIKSIALDDNTRYVLARIENDGVLYDIGSGAVVQLIVIRPDKVGVQIGGESKEIVIGVEDETPVTTHYAFAELDQPAIAVQGTLLGQFKITSGDQILRTQIFEIKNGEALDSDTWAGEYDGYNLDELVEKVDAAVDKVDGMEADVSELKSDLNHTISKNLIGMEANVLYPVFIKAGTKLTVSTSDGSNFPSSSSDILYLYLYDKDGNRTDYFGLANGQPTRTITTSASKADTYYLAWNRKYDVPLQVEVGDTKTDYSEYFLSVEALNEEVKPIGNHVANIGDLIGNVSIKNLLDTSKAIDGGYYDSDNVWVSNANLYVSDLIPCVDGMRYINNYTQNINLYDYNGNHIGYVRNSDSDRSFVASSVKGKVCYFRVYGTQSNKATDAVFIGDAYWGTSEEYHYESEALVNIGTPTSKLLQKNVYTFGDSRTWYDGKAYVANTVIAGQICKGYQFWMRKLLQCNTINKGVSGYTSPQMLATVQSADISDADVVTLAGGINDFLQSIPVGSIAPIGSNFDTSTVFGATQAMIESIISRKPSVKLMLINPFTGWINNDADEYPDTYASVKRNLAELYHLPILDLTRSCGFNALNKSTFYCDDMTKVSYRLHLNDLGNEVIGHMIASFVGNGY